MRPEHLPGQLHVSAPPHYAWDRALEPVAQVAPGEVFRLVVQDASDGQLDRASTPTDVLALDFTQVNPVTGPVWVDGTQPGDVLVVTVLDLEVDDWGWTANIPGFGLLSDDFPDPALRLSAVTGHTVEFLPGLHLPLMPMIGTIGVAPADPGPHSLVPPHAWGGNMDLRHLTAGSTLYLPVAVEGALLSVGDTHACQGDGEICGTDIPWA